MVTVGGWPAEKRTLLIRMLAANRIASVIQKRGLRIGARASGFVGGGLEAGGGWFWAIYLATEPRQFRTASAYAHRARADYAAGSALDHATPHQPPRRSGTGTTSARRSRELIAGGAHAG